MNKLHKLNTFDALAFHTLISQLTSRAKRQKSSPMVKIACYYRKRDRANQSAERKTHHFSNTATQIEYNYLERVRTLQTQTRHSTSVLTSYSL